MATKHIHLRTAVTQQTAEILESLLNPPADSLPDLNEIHANDTLLTLAIQSEKSKLNPPALKAMSDADFNALKLRKIELLLNANADPNLSTSKGSPLSIALDNKNLAAFSLLLRRRADPRRVVASDRHDDLPNIIFAIGLKQFSDKTSDSRSSDSRSLDFLKAVREFTQPDFPIDLEQRDNVGRTALVPFVGGDKLACVKYLIAWGAKVEILFNGVIGKKRQQLSMVEFSKGSSSPDLYQFILTQTTLAKYGELADEVRATMLTGPLMPLKKGKVDKKLEFGQAMVALYDPSTRREVSDMISTIMSVNGKGYFAPANIAIILEYLTEILVPQMPDHLAWRERLEKFSNFGVKPCYSYETEKENIGTCKKCGYLFDQHICEEFQINETNPDNCSFCDYTMQEHTDRQTELALGGPASIEVIDEPLRTLEEQFNKPLACDRFEHDGQPSGSSDDSLERCVHCTQTRQNHNTGNKYLKYKHKYLSLKAKLGL